MELEMAAASLSFRGFAAKYAANSRRDDREEAISFIVRIAAYPQITSTQLLLVPG
ncbi:hypothetical protein [Rhizobium sp. R634]|uniref:hypothetical protein n=1 Tax=Rhizobium sp. R634 TaxID=1764274 RepID=UPI00167EA295|nr:hypothetical protein [Rhizobium sp. R634]